MTPHKNLLITIFDKHFRGEYPVIEINNNYIKILLHEEQHLVQSSFSGV